MTEILQDVLSSTPLDACPRESLGLLCTSEPGGYECICKDVAACVLKVEQDTRGPVAVLTLTLAVGVSDWQNIRKGIALTGLRAGWKVTPGGLDYGTTIEVSVDLYRPENAQLREYLSTGI